MSKLGNLKIFDYKRNIKSEIKTGRKDVGQSLAESVFAIHKAVGAGLDASVYLQCLHKDLTDKGFKVQRNVPCSAHYRGFEVKAAFVADIVIDDSVLVLVKSEAPAPDMHKMQLRTALKNAPVQDGFLINFGREDIQNGIMHASYTSGNVLSAQNHANEVH